MWGEVVRRAVALFAEVDGESEGSSPVGATGRAGLGAALEEQSQGADHEEDWVSVLWSDAE